MGRIILIYCCFSISKFNLDTTQIYQTQNSKKTIKIQTIFKNKQSLLFRSSRPEVFCIKGVLRNFAKFTRKHLCQRPVTLLRKRLWHRWVRNFLEHLFYRTPLVAASIYCFCFFVFLFVFFCLFLSRTLSRITGRQGKGEGISSTTHYHFHPVHRHLGISRAIVAGSSPLHMASSRARTLVS